MRRFVPGVDSYLGTGAPASLMRFSDPESNEPSAVGNVELITEKTTSLSEKYRQLCYWRQIVNAEHN
jgi:hypothetical protein